MLANSKRLFDISDTAFAQRLQAVQRALYLLFNEGYHGASAESAVRIELCREAMRLAALLREHPLAATPATYALSALMCLHAARLPSRVDRAGHFSPFLDQDRSRWDSKLVQEGERLLEQSASGSELSEYHIEAAIAWVHARAKRVEDTDWAEIVSLYDTLLKIRPSPVVALNRAIAVAQLDGPERGLAAIAAIPDKERLKSYPFYAAALGELELRNGKPAPAHQHFQAALALARNPTERLYFEQRLGACERARTEHAPHSPSRTASRSSSC